MIQIAAGTLELGDNNITAGPPSGEHLQITGAGKNETIIHSTLPAGDVIWINAIGPTVEMTQVTIRLDGTPTATRTAVKTTGGVFSWVGFEVTSSGEYSSVGLGGLATCEYCAFALSGSSAEAGVASSNFVVTDSTIRNVGPTTDYVRGFRQIGGGNGDGPTTAPGLAKAVSRTVKFSR